MMRTLVVEPPADAEAAAAWTTPEERSTAAGFGSERRAREYLGWRTVVRRHLGRGTAIGYDAVGAPTVEGCAPVRIGVSHCRGYVAVGFADGPCGVDIERRDRDFSRVVRRYLTPEEEALAADEVWPGAAWCAKETLYKLAGRRELDLRDDLRLLRAELRCCGAERSAESEAELSAARAALRPESVSGRLPERGWGEVVGRIGDGGPVRLAVWWDEELIVVHTV